MQIESSQVTLAIIEPTYKFEHPETGEVISGKAIHDQMKTNRVLRKNDLGEFSIIQYNQQEFQFWMPAKGRDRKTITVPRSVAESLIAGSVIAVGPLKEALSRPMVPYLEVVSQYNLGTETAPASHSPTMCGICNAEMNTLPRLTRHYDKHKRTHPEYFKSDVDAAMDEADKTEANEGLTEANTL